MARAVTRRRRRRSPPPSGGSSSAAHAAGGAAVPERAALQHRAAACGATLRSFRGVVQHRHGALPRSGARGRRHPRAARLSAARPELRIDRRARSRDLRLPRSAAAGDRSRARAIRACTAASRSSPRRARSRSATSIRTSTSPAGSPATPSSICGMLGDYDWRLSEQNVWKVERMLLDYPHRPIRSVGRADRRLRATLSRSTRRSAPGRKPRLLPRTRTWTRAAARSSSHADRLARSVQIEVARRLGDRFRRWPAAAPLRTASTAHRRASARR